MKTRPIVPDRTRDTIATHRSDPAPTLVNYPIEVKRDGCAWRASIGPEHNRETAIGTTPGRALSYLALHLDGIEWQIGGY
jgi:hypothetical protein